VANIYRQWIVVTTNGGSTYRLQSWQTLLHTSRQGKHVVPNGEARLPLTSFAQPKLSMYYRIDVLGGHRSWLLRPVRQTKRPILTGAAPD
jgi:hypothetical protein